ncbi:hypothetical protein ElyMa_000445900 [Elysia marginata]|uniref:N-acetyltransferase domain-containing protein n=1 Tax=Elysia marginata TaxID=1093978 RepID=A0AAV4FPC4_9GAST|nr:hypothetical protein ElyMa_000445900 [Elysia marginata]
MKLPAIPLATAELKPLAYEDSEAIASIYQTDTTQHQPAIHSTQEASQFVRMAEQLSDNQQGLILGLTQHERLQAIIHIYGIEPIARRAFIRIDNWQALTDNTLVETLACIVQLSTELLSLHSVHYQIIDDGSDQMRLTGALEILGFSPASHLRDFYKLRPNHYCDVSIYTRTIQQPSH